MKKTNGFSLANAACKVSMQYGCGLLFLLAAPSAADSNTADRHALPPSKVNIEACQREALRLHPGLIDELRVLPQPKTFWIRYQIQMRDGTDWFVVCDLSNGKIIHDHSLDIKPSL
ncbi:hypothetical protein [Methylomonas rivi]|uniref:PepSY domain-containing protein n=1 Tax=Methylomonas rivi TaxID=2952226 RepID=A0ABT1U2L0_9GAMM|nr:hypothetical protein [Methylomonas sp. WSC-6]MCQ8127654.1 hypothetical protein [Methylomonas sp. WSC-6]